MKPNNKNSRRKVAADRQKERGRKTTSPRQDQRIRIYTQADPSSVTPAVTKIINEAKEQGNVVCISVAKKSDMLEADVIGKLKEAVKVYADAVKAGMSDQSVMNSAGVRRSERLSAANSGAGAGVCPEFNDSSTHKKIQAAARKKLEEFLEQKQKNRELEDLVRTEEDEYMSEIEIIRVLDYVYDHRGGAEAKFGPPYTRGVGARREKLFKKIRTKHGIDKHGKDKHGKEVLLCLGLSKSGIARMRDNRVKREKEGDNRPLQRKNGRPSRISFEALLKLLCDACDRHLLHNDDMGVGGSNDELVEALCKAVEMTMKEEGKQGTEELSPGSISKYKNRILASGKSHGQTQIQTRRRQDAQNDVRNAISLAISLESELFDLEHDRFLSPAMITNHDATSVVIGKRDGEGCTLRFVPSGAERTGEEQKIHGTTKASDSKRGSAAKALPQVFKLICGCNALGRFLPFVTVKKLNDKEWGKMPRRPWIHQLRGFSSINGNEGDGFIILVPKGTAPEGKPKNYYNVAVQELYIEHVLKPGLRRFRQEYFPDTIDADDDGEKDKIPESGHLAGVRVRGLHLFDGEAEQLQVVKSKENKAWFHRNGITLIKLAAACSGWMQPLDVCSLFRSIKKTVRSGNARRYYTQPVIMESLEGLQNLIKEKGGKDAGFNQGHWANLKMAFAEMGILLNHANSATSIQNGFMDVGIVQVKNELGCCCDREKIFARCTALLSDAEKNNILQERNWNGLLRKYHENGGVIYEEDYDECTIRRGARTHTKQSLNYLAQNRQRTMRIAYEGDKEKRDKWIEKQLQEAKKKQDDAKKKTDAAKKKKKNDAEKKKEMTALIRTQKKELKAAEKERAHQDKEKRQVEEKARWLANENAQLAAQLAEALKQLEAAQSTPRKRKAEDDTCAYSTSKKSRKSA